MIRRVDLRGVGHSKAEIQDLLPRATLDVNEAMKLIEPINSSNHWNSLLCATARMRSELAGLATYEAIGAENALEVRAQTWR